jgi:hypothetical protein
MAVISDRAAAALRGAISTRGPHRGMLKATAPKHGSDAWAAWHGAMMVCNPYKVSIAAVMFMDPERRALMREVESVLESAGIRTLDRDRNNLERLGVW